MKAKINNKTVDFYYSMSIIAGQEDKSKIIDHLLFLKKYF